MQLLEWFVYIDGIAYAHWLWFIYNMPTLKVANNYYTWHFFGYCFIFITVYSKKLTTLEFRIYVVADKRFYLAC